MRLTHESHMPNLGEAGHHLLPRLCAHILNQSTAVPPRSRVSLTDAPYTVHTLSGNGRAQANRTPMPMTVSNQRSHHTLLRRDPKGDSQWAAGVAVMNGASVSVLGQTHDHQGHEMLLVQGDVVRGWIYARNLLEMQ